MSGERIRKGLRDFGCLLLGFGIIWHQAFVIPPGKASEWLLGTGLALIAGPGGLGAWSLLRGTPTPGPESPQAPSASSRQSQQSSSA